MSRRLIGLTRKEFIQFFRDKALVMLVLYTFVEIALCGWALTLELRSLPTAIYDGDHSAESRDLVSAFSRLEGFEVKRTATTPDELESWIADGKIQFGLIVPAGYSRAILRGETAEVQLLIDGSNSNLANQALAVAAGLLRDYNAQAITEQVAIRGQGGHSFLPQVVNKVRFWYMPQLKFSHFVILTMLAISVLVLSVLLPAASIVREKEAGTFEQLMVTPVTGAQLVFAKTVPMILLKTVGLAIGLAIAVWWFGAPLRGSLLLFYVFSLLMFLAGMGIGVLIGTVAQNMQQTLLMVFFLFFPMAFLSGTMVPVFNMPVALQWLTLLSPLRYYVDATLGIFLKGVGLDILWPQALALAAMSIVLLGSGVLRLRKSLA